MSYTLNQFVMEFSWSEFLAGSSMTAVTQEVIRYYRRKSESKFNLADNLSDIAKIHNTMEKVVAETRFERFMIFKGEDSAGVLAAGKKLYISAQYEKLCKDNETLYSISELIQRWEADHHYYSLFSQMLSQQKVIVRTGDMPESKLKALYLMQGVKYAQIEHLMTTKNNAMVFYYSAAILTDSEPTAEDQAILDGNVSIIKNIFQKHRKFY